MSYSFSKRVIISWSRSFSLAPSKGVVLPSVFAVTLSRRKPPSTGVGSDTPPTGSASVSFASSGLMSGRATSPISPPFAFDAADECAFASAEKSSPAFAASRSPGRGRGRRRASFTRISCRVTVGGFVNCVAFTFSYSARSSVSVTSTLPRMSRSST